MKWCAIFKLSAAALAGLLTVGCASSPMSGSSDARYDADKPQIFLPDAGVQEVKGLAMGSAVSKGWTLAESGDDTLILQRTLNAAAAESISPGAGLGPLPPVVKVRSTFFPRMGGVDVVLDAQVVTQRGGEQEKREDFTDSYRPELMRSLASLRKAWDESRWRVASAIPPLPTTQPVSQDELEGDATEGTPGYDDTATASASPVVSQPWGSGVQSAWGTTPDPVSVGTVVIEDRSPVLAAETGQPQGPSRPMPATLATANPDTNMLTLRKPQDTGIWAYYAEHYARIRGCTLTADGAVLVKKSEYWETHRVDCDGGNSFLVKCNAGVCRGLR